MSATSTSTIQWTVRPSGAVLPLFPLAVALLITDHGSHAFGIVPYLLLLACPLMYLLHGRQHGTGLVEPAARRHEHVGRVPTDGAAR